MPLITIPPATLTILGAHGLVVPPPLAKTIEVLRCAIAGTGHHCDEHTGRRLLDAPSLALVREPDNEYDEHAIAVHCDGRRVGYIPRCHNTVLACLLDAGKGLRARVVSVLDPDDSPWLDAEIVVELLD